MAAETLAGRRILVTRPRRQAGNLRRAIGERGGKAVICPMLQITPVEVCLPSAWWRNQEWLVFVSANAVRYAVEAGLKAPAAKLAAIGRATAAELEKNALPVACQAPPPYTSESLLSQPPFRQVTGQRVMIVRGVGGRPMLAEELTRRGAKVSLLELYRRLPPEAGTVDKLRAGLSEGLAGVLVTSGEALNNLTRAAGDQVESLRSLPLIVSSGRLAKMARAAGFADVATASSAADADMLRALEERLG